MKSRHQQKVDKVRASRDGHEFHEAWAARKATQLVLRQNDLTAIAVEGLSPTDRPSASDQTIAIADLTLYFGEGDNFQHASRTTIVQLKYSIASQDKDFRAADAKKTIEKFGNTYREFKKQYGARSVQKKLDFQLVTNQPISESLLQAVDALSKNLPQKGKVKSQAMQFQVASGLTGKSLTEFARKFNLVGRAGSLPESKNELASLLVDWSATSDAIASARLSKLRDLVRNKAGQSGFRNNLITCIDILAVLEIGDVMDLLPCSSALPNIGEVLEREQLSKVLNEIDDTSRPLLIHAAGGVGKTVFMESLAKRLTSNYEVVFFDCFGGGAYRSPEDARHLPKRGLMHIANTLAFRGLCDPILPGSSDLQSLLSTFRRRLKQCDETISRVIPGRKIALFIDAIDNAEIAALKLGEDCFPIKILESLHTEPIENLKLVISCRTERKPNTYADLNDFELNPFSINETAAFLRLRLKKIKPIEINVAHARSHGNPRVLEYLLDSGRSQLVESKQERLLELDNLIQQRITDTVTTAVSRGCEENDIQIFLAGLAVLPPPVPLEEYASAHGIDISAIESFASDLSPLLERTSQGLVFRDEPTETLVLSNFASTGAVLRRIATNLHARQGESVYAARALPNLLYELDEGEKLLELAFDDRIPSSITSKVGKQGIKYARLKVATRHAARNKNYNSLVRLLLELSIIVAADQRGAEYILEFPDLVVAAQDVDATRRLFETRTGWPGSRHAGLAIANLISGDFEEAHRHAYAAHNWIVHYFRTPHKDRQHDKEPNVSNIAAIPFLMISQSHAKDAARYLQRWREWYVYDVCQFALEYSQLAQRIRSQPVQRVENFLDEITGIGALAAALSIENISQRRQKEMVIKLARHCKRTTNLELRTMHYQSENDAIEDGLRISAAIALSLGLSSEAATISLRAPHPRPHLWMLQHAFRSQDIFSYIYRVALLAAAKKKEIHEKDLIPTDIVPACVRIPRKFAGKDFVAVARDKIQAYVGKKSNSAEKGESPDSLSYKDFTSAEQFLDYQLGPLLDLTRAFSSVLGAQRRNLDKAFLKLIQVWESIIKNYNSHLAEHYSTEQEFSLISLLGLEIAIFCLHVRSCLKQDSVERFVSAVHSHGVSVQTLVRIITILAQRTQLHELAGEQAMKARLLISKKVDVNDRVSLFGDLARAILPANVEEASVYFRDGLEQLDAIGSGDYELTHELLLYASQLNGNEIKEREFHTLSNICELHFENDAEKFYWADYGRGFSRVSGLRGLAKLSRWDDRAQINLRNTLLPYLIGLLECGKIEARDALALNRLAKPVEYYFAGTKELIETLPQSARRDPVLVEELIRHFLDDNQNLEGGETLEKLESLAKNVHGCTSDIAKFLADINIQNKTNSKVRSELDKNHNDSKQVAHDDTLESGGINAEKVSSISVATNPIDEDSLTCAINGLNGLGNWHDFKDDYFRDIRGKVPYSKRERYLRIIAKLDNLHSYWKIAELENAKQTWGNSSASLVEVFRSFAVPLLRQHGLEFAESYGLIDTEIERFTKLTDLSTVEVVAELIEVLLQSDSSVSGSVWLKFATIICPYANKMEGEQALERLLSKHEAKLADKVIDGNWHKRLYPKSDIFEVAAGLVWRILGSAYANDRWHGAHCIRSFVKFGRWEVVDRLVDMIELTDAGPFQADELPFFYMHARLWLLISLARLAIDYPAEVARYKAKLLPFALGNDSDHVLMRHFAARTLISCTDAGHLELTSNQAYRLNNVDTSPYPRLNETLRTGGDYYSDRTDSEPKPNFDFQLDFDFQDDVDNLAQVFGQSDRKVANMMSEIVHSMDSDVESMYDSSGRKSKLGWNTLRMTSQYHTYGQQLGYHALFIAAGKLLEKYPITRDSFDESPWEEWLSRYLLTRGDGLWLSDGTDRMPVETRTFLLEQKHQCEVLTGDRKKILRLIGANSQKHNELIIDGEWLSLDNVRVYISSALVPSDEATELSRKLTQEIPMTLRLPCLDETEDGSEYRRGKYREFVPWIVRPSGEARLDENDPYGVSLANRRPRLANEYTEFCSLVKCDHFGRIWEDENACESMRAQAWGRERNHPHIESPSGTRLCCNTSIVKRILSNYDKDLLILVKLERYESKTNKSNSKFSHTVAVVRVTKNLDIEYFEGRVNHEHKNRYRVN